LRFFEIISRLFAILRNSLKFFKIFGDSLGFFEIFFKIFRNYLRFFRILGDSYKILRFLRRLFRISLETFYHSWRFFEVISEFLWDLSGFFGIFVGKAREIIGDR